MAKVKEVPENTTESEPALEHPWNVVVHNDPVNLMSYVTMVFQKVFGFPREHCWCGDCSGALIWFPNLMAA